MTGAKRYQALRFNEVPRHQLQPIALREGSQEYRRLREGESGADADAPAAAKRQIGKARARGGLLSRKPLGVESAGIRP